MGVFERGPGPVTARKLRAEESEQGVENSVNMNLPPFSRCAREGWGTRHPAILVQAIIIVDQLKHHARIALRKYPIWTSSVALRQQREKNR